MRPWWRSRARSPDRSLLAAGAATYAEARPPRSSSPWRAAAWCALDFELTGLDLSQDEVISFGAIPIDGGRVQLRRAVSGLVRPEREVGEASIRVHGIRAVDLARAPPLGEAIDELLAVLAGRALVVHTAAIERTFLGRALAEQGLRLRGPVADTEQLGRLWLHRRDGALRRRLGLAELAGALGLPADRQHSALGDALTTAQVFIALATHLEADRQGTVGALAGAGRRLEGIRLFGHGYWHGAI